MTTTHDFKGALSCEICGMPHATHTNSGHSPPLDKQGQEDLNDWLQNTAAAIAVMVIDKRADYGTMNINMTGQAGVATRALDKVARILHITKKRETPPDNPTDRIIFEPLVDSWRDLAGYALIGLWLEETGEPW